MTWPPMQFQTHFVPFSVFSAESIQPLKLSCLFTGDIAEVLKLSKKAVNRGGLLRS